MSIFSFPFFITQCYINEPRKNADRIHFFRRSRRCCHAVLSYHEVLCRTHFPTLNSDEQYTDTENRDILSLTGYIMKHKLPHMVYYCRCRVVGGSGFTMSKKKSSMRTHI